MMKESKEVFPLYTPKLKTSISFTKEMNYDRDFNRPKSNWVNWNKEKIKNESYAC